MALLNFLKPKNVLEEGGRTSAPVQRDAGEPEKKCPNCSGTLVEKKDKIKCMSCEYEKGE